MNLNQLLGQAASGAKCDNDVLMMSMRSNGMIVPWFCSTCMELLGLMADQTKNNRIQNP